MGVWGVGGEAFTVACKFFDQHEWWLPHGCIMESLSSLQPTNLQILLPPKIMLTLAIKAELQTQVAGRLGDVDRLL